MRTERITELEGCPPFCQGFDAIISTDTIKDGKEDVWRMVTSCKHKDSCQTRSLYKGEATDEKG